VLWVLTGAVESDLWMNLHAPRDKKLRGERMKWRDGGLAEGGGGESSERLRQLVHGGAGEDFIRWTRRCRRSLIFQTPAFTVYARMHRSLNLKWRHWHLNAAPASIPTPISNSFLRTTCCSSRLRHSSQRATSIIQIANVAAYASLPRPPNNFY
jgi:hypothetical protein